MTDPKDSSGQLHEDLVEKFLSDEAQADNLIAVDVPADPFPG